MSDRHAQTDCPSCGSPLDASSHPTDNAARPAKGDGTLCAYCGALLIYADDELHLRRPTAEEVDEAESLPQFQDARRQVLANIARRGGARRWVPSR